ncbi:MAG: DUF6056 family protein [Candidatus Gastranaerophilales bacterium]|nr:DUF6056 family protein [Candidatus Gastranaerophilales bacterium]
MDRKKLRMILINIAFVLALLIVIFPLLLIAQYNYPSADDWSFGTMGYHALKNKEGLLGVIRAAFAVVSDNYRNWEGRFSNAFFASLQPGIWGEKYYGVVAWMMIGGLIVSEWYLCRSLIDRYAKGSGGWLSIPIIVPSLIMQILYTPSPEESFYWYTGSVNYTFVYGLSLILLALFLKLGTGEYTKGAYIWRAIVTCILAVLVGGNNFSTSLSSFLALFLLSALFLWLDRRAFYRTWFVMALTGVSLLICIFAPGNTARVNANFSGEKGSAVEAVFMSLVRSFTNIYSWSADIKTLIVLLLILPFLWKAVKTMDCSFRFPGLFTLVTFGLYASQVTPNLYIEGSISSGRLGAILFYSYHLWLVGNVGYWIGWISRRKNKLTVYMEQISGKAGKYLLIYCAIVGLLLGGVIYRFDLRSLTSYRAYRSWRQGWAQQYAKEWEERLEVLHDDSVKEVCFSPLSVYPEMILYTDLQEADGYTWVNVDCAKYYDKDVIRVVAQE